MWLNGPMNALDPEVLEKDVKDMWKANFKSIKNFDTEEGTLLAPLKVAETLKAQIDEFQAKLPLISCLCNKGMRERHWAEVSTILGYPFKPNDSTTLSSVLTMGLETHMEKLEEIAGSASKEYKARFRSLMFNLRDPKNPEFIRSVRAAEEGAPRAAPAHPRRAVPTL